MAASSNAYATARIVRDRSGNLSIFGGLGAAAACGRPRVFLVAIISVAVLQAIMLE
jgi:hypothetical protein